MLEARGRGLLGRGDMEDMGSGLFPPQLLGSRRCFFAHLPWGILRGDLMKAAFVREPPQVFAADMRNKLQPGVSGPGELGRLRRGGHLQPAALHEPHTESTMSVLSLTPGF